MTRKYRLRRLGQASVAEPGPPTAPEPVESDPGQLAREAAAAFAQELERYRSAGGTGIDPRDRPDDWQLRISQEKPPQDVTFFDIERLAQVDPARALARWEQVVAAAGQDLESGWLAARALEHMGGSAWERACFKTVRDHLRRTWRPRNDAESLLVDEIAQYEVLRQRWMAILGQFSREPQTIAGLRARGEREEHPRTAGAAIATQEAAKMVDRMQLLAQRAIRTLQGLRRAPAVVTVRNTGPVNVALGPQMNLSATTAGPPDGPVAGPRDV